MKTPAPQRAASRKRLAVKRQALGDGSYPIPNVDYLKRAIRSVGRAPASKRPALARLIRKRAAELKATGAAGVKGTWAFQGANAGAPAIELTGDGRGHHVAGTPNVYSHGWKPVAGTVVSADGIRRPGKATVLKAADAPAKTPLVAAGKPTARGTPKGVLSGPLPADRLTVASDPSASAKAMPAADLKSADQELSRRAAVLGKLGQLSAAHKAVRAELAARRGAATRAPAAKAARKAVTPVPPAAGNPAGGKALREAIKSGVASRKAPGSAKVTGSQGEQGGVEVVTFGNGAQYIHKDFKGIVIPRPESQGGPRRMSLEEKKLMVAKESLAAKISDVIGAGAPAILRDPGSATGFYEPKVAGVSAMEYFKDGKRSPAKMYDSPEGMKIGLLDAVIGADDRHLGNVMITPDGKPVPIDHNDTWVTGQRLLTRSPFEVALGKRIKAGKSPFSVAALDEVQGRIQALKAEFNAMPGGGGPGYYQMTMAKLAQIRGQVAGR